MHRHKVHVCIHNTCEDLVLAVHSPRAQAWVHTSFQFPTLSIVTLQMISEMNLSSIAFIGIANVMLTFACEVLSVDSGDMACYQPRCVVGLLDGSRLRSVVARWQLIREHHWLWYIDNLRCWLTTAFRAMSAEHCEYVRVLGMMPTCASASLNIPCAIYVLVQSVPVCSCWFSTWMYRVLNTHLL